MVTFFLHYKLWYSEEIKKIVYNEKKKTDIKRRKWIQLVSLKDKRNLQFCFIRKWNFWMIINCINICFEEKIIEFMFFFCFTESSCLISINTTYLPLNYRSLVRLQSIYTISRSRIIYIFFMRKYVFLRSLLYIANSQTQK